MSRRNRMIVRKLRNIVILLMAIIVMIGAYKNIKDSRAEDVIEIDAIAIDNYGYLSNELFNLEATQIGDELYEIELPESVNGKEINQIITVTLEEPIPEVETESGVQENASTENEVETEPDGEVLDETTTIENNTSVDEIPETITYNQETVEILDANTTKEKQESAEDKETTVQDEPKEEKTEQIPTESENVLEIIDNKITLTKEQIDNKQLNIEVVYNVAILETTEQGEISKNILTEKTEEERQEIEITEETQVLYSKILKYEDEENQKLVEVKGFLPKNTELNVEEVSQEQLTEIFGKATIDVAYDIKLVIHVTKEVLIDETDPSKGTKEIIETIEVNPEEFGESCEVSIKDVKIQEESQVYHVKEDNTYEQVNVKENTEENITFDAQTFSIYAVSTDEQIMLSAASGSIYWDSSYIETAAKEWEEQKVACIWVRINDDYDTIEDADTIKSADVKFSWNTEKTSGGTNSAETATGFVPGVSTIAGFYYGSTIEREGIYYLGFTVTATSTNGSTLSENSYLGPFYIDKKAPGATTYSAYYADDNSAYNGEWTNRQVKTKLTSTDAGSGVSYFQFQKSGDSTWTQATSGGSSTTQSGTTYTYNEPWELKDRNDTYTFRAVDGLGHTSSASSDFTVKYDLTAPTTPTITAKNADGTTYTSGSWTKQSVSITASATDAGSGVAKYQYRTNGSTWYDMTNGTVTFSSEMNGTVYVRAVDALGYVSESSSIVIRIDKTNPSFTSAEIKNISSTGYDVYVYGVRDNYSGINRVQFPTWTDLNNQDDLSWGGNWQTASTNSGTDMGNGTWYYRVNTSDHNNEDGWYNTHIYVYDNVGNSWGNAQLIIGDDEDDGKVYIDRTPPQITIDTDNGIIKKGLIRHYDAANNAGNGYDDQAETWKDLSGHYDADVPHYQEAWEDNGFLYLGTDISLGDFGTLTQGYTIEAEMLLEESMSFYTQGDWEGFGLFGTASGWVLDSHDDILFPCGVSGVNPQVYGTADLGEVLTCSITWDEANHIYSVYINGNIVYTVNVQHECDGSNTEGSWGEFEIGPYRNHLNLKSIRVYNTALSKEQIYQNLLASGVSVSNSGLVRHYDAVNNTGSGYSNTTTTWKDLSGNYDGTINGATFKNSNLSFDGVDDWVNIGQISLDNVVSFETTLELKSIQSGEIDIINNFQNGGVGLCLYDGKPSFSVYISGTGWKEAKSSETLEIGKKYHIAGIYDGTSIRLYINGQLRAEVYTTGTIKVPDNSTVMAIGVNPSGGSSTDGGFLNGKIYNAKIYTRPLTEYEVYKTAYDAGLAEELEPENVGLIRYFSALNNTGSGHSNSATTWKDLSGNSDGTVGGATFYDNYLSFDGVDDYVQSGSLDLSSNRITVDTTIELKSIQSGIADIINYTEHGGFSLHVWDGKPYFSVYITDVGYPSVLLEEALEINTKYRITATYDGAYIKLYINGELKAETAASGTIKAPIGTPRLVLGAEMGEIGNVDGYYANINMYEAKVYNRALAASEISPDEGQTWKKEHTVTVTLSDDYSGLASGANIKYGWSTSTTTPPTSYTTANLSYSAGDMETTFEASGSGLTGKYYLWVVPNTLADLYGNSQSVTAISSDTYWFDNTTPTITFDPQQNETWAKSQSVSVNIGDAHSGLAAGAQVQYQWVAQGSSPSSSGWTTKTIDAYTEGTNSVTFTVTNSTLTGKYKLYVKVQTLKDTSEIGGNELVTGEIMTSDGYFWLDNTKPTLNVISTGNETWAKSHTATVTIADAHSGLASGMSLQYGWGTENGVTPTSWTTATITAYSAGATSITFTATGSGFTGKYYLWVKPTTLGDVVGNEVTETIKVSSTPFYFDNTKPMIEIDPIEEINGLTASDITADDYGGIVTNYAPSNGSTGNWQIFHSDGENIYLIAQDYVQNIYVPAGKGGTGIAKYGNYGVGFTNVVNGYTGSVDINSELAEKWLSQYTYTSVTMNMKTTAYLLDTDVWSEFKDNNYAEYAIGGPTLEMFVASYNTKHPSQTIEISVPNPYGYGVKWSTASSYSSMLYEIDTTDKLYVKSNSTHNAQIIASPFYNMATDVGAVALQDVSGTKGCLGGMAYTIGSTSTWFGISPIICLKADTQLAKQSDETYQIVENTGSTEENIVQEITNDTWSKNKDVKVKIYDKHSGLAANAQFKYGWSTSLTTEPTKWNTVTVSNYSAGTGSATFTAIASPETIGETEPADKYYLWVEPVDFKDISVSGGNSQTEGGKSSELYWIDAKKPTVTFNLQQNETWSRSHSVEVIINDAHSGLAQLEAGALIEYQWVLEGETPSDDGWEILAQTLNYTEGTNEDLKFSITKNGLTGKYKLYIKTPPFKDLSQVGGNETDSVISSTGTYWFDNKAPIVNLGSQGNAEWEQSYSIPVTVTDEHSGIRLGTELQYGWSTSATTEPTQWQDAVIPNYTAGVESVQFNAVTPSTLEPGKYYLWVKPETVVDVVGNAYNATQKIISQGTFWLDNKKPTITVDPQEREVWAKTHSVDVAINDAHSGLAEGIELQYQWVKLDEDTGDLIEQGWQDVEIPDYTEGDTALDTITITTSDLRGKYYFWLKPVTLQDVAGNEETEIIKSTGTFWFDYIPPQITITPEENTTWKQTHTATVGIFDEHCGLELGAVVKYGWSTSNTTEPTTWTEVDLAEDGTPADYERETNDVITFTAEMDTQLETGEYYLWVVPVSLQDIVGNIAETKISTGTFYIDTTPPTITLESEENTTYKKVQTVDVILQDEHSGMASGNKIKYGWSTSTSTAPSSYTTVNVESLEGYAEGTNNPLSFTATTEGLISATGKYYLWVVPYESGTDMKLVDEAGNSQKTTTKSTGTFYIDLDKPTLTVSPTSSDWKNSAVSVTVTHNDTGGSGIASTSGEYFLSTSESPTEVATESTLSGTYTSGTAFYINPGTTGQYYLFVKQILDNATNTSSTANQVTIGGVTYHRYGLYKFDYIKPIWSYVSKDIYYSTENDAGNDDYANRERTVKIAFKGTDEHSGVKESTLLTADKIDVSVNGTPVTISNDDLDIDYDSATKEVTCTLTITNITGDGTLNVVLKSGSLEDNATNTNDPNTLTTDVNIEIDNTSPNLSFNVTSPTAGYYKAGQVITITATYNENVYKEITSNNLIDTTAEAPAMALTFGGAAAKGTVSCSSVSGNVITYTYTIQGATNTEGTNGDNGTLVVSSLGTVYDAAGNAISASNVTPSVSIVADTIAPTLTITADKTSPTNASSITYTFTFSEGVTEFTADDVTVTNGTESTFASISSSVYTLIVTNTESCTQTVNVYADKCVDRAGNGNKEATGVSIEIDRDNPTLTVNPSSTTEPEWRNSALSVTITATDPIVNGVTSGLSTSNEYKYFLSTSTSPTAVPTEATLSGTYTSGTAFDINPETSGQYYLYVKQISDKATNTSSTANQVTIGGVIYHRYGLYKFDYDQPRATGITLSKIYTNTGIITATANGVEDIGGSGMYKISWFVKNSSGTRILNGVLSDGQWYKEINISAQPEGWYKVGIVLHDNAGNKNDTTDGAWQVSDSYIGWIDFCYDKTAPTAPITMEYSFENWDRYTQGTWTNKSVYAAYASSDFSPSGATDSLSGVEKYQISDDNNTWIDYAYDDNNPMYRFTTQGTHIRYFRAVDKAGNAGPSINRTAQIDLTRPTLTVSPTSSDWKNSAVSVTITHNDTGGSGVASDSGSYFLSTNASPTTVQTGSTVSGTYTSGTAFDINPGTSGEYYLYVRQISDNATNGSSTTDYVTIGGEKYHRYGLYKFDYIKPTGTSTTDGITMTKDPTITIYVDDVEDTGGSGIRDIYIVAWTGGGYSSFGKSVKATYDSANDRYYATMTFSELPNTTSGDTNQGSGTYYFDAHIYDVAGNKMIPTTTRVIYDITAPTPGTLIMKKGDSTGEDYEEDTWTNQSIYIAKVDGSDEHSGHQSTTYTVKKDGVEFLTNQTEPATLTETGVYEITVTTTDNVGNTATNSHIYKVKIDKDQPITTGITLSTIYTNTGIITATANGVEDIGGSGMNSIHWYVKNTSGSTVRFSATSDGEWYKELNISEQPEGWYKVGIVLHDNAGNQNDTTDGTVHTSYIGWIDFCYDKTSPTWTTENIAKTSGTVTVDLVGTDALAGYASNSLDINDITVKVDGETASSVTKELSGVTYYKADGTVTTNESEAVKVKYTLTLSGLEQSTLQAGKIFKEWSGAVSIDVTAGSLTDKAGNTNVADSYSLGHADFIKPVIELVSANNGTTTQTIVFNVIDKYLDTTDANAAVKEDEIIVYIDGVEVSGITKTIKSKTNLTATVNGDSTHIVGQQYTLELSGFTQDAWSGTVSVIVKADATEDTTDNKNIATTLIGKHIDEVKPVIEKVSSTKDPSAGTETIILNVMDKYLDTTDALIGSEIKVYVDNVDVTDDITKTITKIQDFKATVNGNSNHVVGQQYQVVLSGFEKTRSIAYNQYTEYSGTVRIDVVAGAVKDIAKDGSGGNTNNLTPIDGDFVDFIKPDVNYIYSTSDINKTDKYFEMHFEIVDKYFAGIKNTNNVLITEMTNAQLAEYLTTNLAEYFVIKIDDEDVTTNANVKKEITSVTDVTTTGAINKTVIDEATGESSVQSVTNAVIGKRYTLKLSNLEQNPNNGLDYSGVVSVAIKSDKVTDTSENGNLVDTTTIKTGNLPSGGLPSDGTVDVVDPVWVQAEDPIVKTSLQTATITVKAQDKFYDSDSFDETDITVLVNGTEATAADGITVQVVEDTLVSAENGKQYKVTVTGFPQTAYSLKIVINEGAIRDKSGNLSAEQQFILYTTLMETVDETEATSSFLDNPYGIQRQYVEQIIFMETVGGTTSTKWDVSALQDKSIMAWYESRTVSEKTLYTVYIGSKVIMNANLDSSYLFSYIGYDSSCKVTGDTTDNPLIKNLEFLRMDNVNNMYFMFAYTGYSNMKSLDLGSNFNTENVTYMSGMFYECGYYAMESLELGDKFDTSSVTSMISMFANTGYTAMTSLDLSSGTSATNTTQFNTSSVTSMEFMFRGCGYTAMTSLNLGSNFDTSQVTSMREMFHGCGYTAMTSLDLRDRFDTSSVTNMWAMFDSCGFGVMSSLDLGNEFDTSKVTDMAWMFNKCGYTAMTSLDLGDKFDTSKVTNMAYMFSNCGETSMTSLDLGPAFTKIASTNTSFLANTGKEGCVIYAPESIYSSRTSLKLNSTSTTKINYNICEEYADYTYTETSEPRGTINPIYKPEWEHVSTQIDIPNQKISVTIKGYANEVFNIGNTITDPQEYLSTITSTVTAGNDASNLIIVKVDGEVAEEITQTITEISVTVNEVQYKIELSEFEEELRRTGKNFIEWSGNIAIQPVKGTLKDIYGNQNMQSIDLTAGVWTDVEIKDETPTDHNKTSAEEEKMFTDFIKPEFTYKYSSTSTIINHGQEAADEWVKVVFDVTDKYFNSVDTTKFKAENIGVIVDSTQIPSTVVLSKTLTKLKDVYYDRTAGVSYVDPGATGTGTKVGEQYQLQVTGLDQGDGFTYSGPMTLSFPAGCIKDKTGNTSDAKSITLGINEPDQTGSAIIVDVVDPVWTVEGTPQITHAGGVTTATMILIAKDKYYNGNTIISEDNTNQIQVIVDGVDISVDANNDGISDIAPGLVKTIEKLEDIKETRNGTQVTIGEKYKFTLTGLEETDEIFLGNRELYESSNGTSGRIYREYVGNVSAVMPENTIIDQYGNGSNEYPVSLGYIDVIKPEVIKVSSRNIIDATNIENSKQEIVFDIVDKYLATSAITTTDTSKIHVLVDGDEVTDIKKTITDITEFKAMVNGSERTVGYRYTLELSEFETSRTATYGTYTNWSGDISILVDEGTATDTKGSENDDTELDVGYADFIKPDVTYIYATDDIDKTDKEFTMVFEITDKYFNTSTLDADDLTILVDGESTIIDTNGDGTPDTDRITRSLTSTDIAHGKRYTLTLRNLEQLQIQDGDKYLDFSGVITVAIPQGAATDTNTPIANGNDLTTITSGINIPGGTGTGTIVDVVDPLIERISSSANAINQTATITIRGTDKYLNDSTLTTSDILVWVNGQLDGDIDGNGKLEGLETPTLPKTLSTATPLNETRLVNGTNTTKQYGVEYTITISGFAKDVNQVKIQIVKGALTDDSSNGNKLTDLWLYNCLELTSSEDLKTDGFLDGNGTNSTGIARQDIQQVIFTDSLAGSTATGVAKVWDVSAQNDGSIKAWTSQTSAPYTVYIGSDFEIFANQNSTYLFGNIGRGTSCTATETLKGLNLLNTCSVTNMSYMFASCGYNAMTGLDLSAGTIATNTTQFNTSNVTNMTGMFFECGYTAMITLNLGNNFDTSKVTDMTSMFNSCGYTAMTGLDLKAKFNTQDVTTMNAMFGKCGYTAMISLNLGTNFNTSNVKDMDSMFWRCGHMTMTSLDLSAETTITNTTQFNTSNVESMDSMFLYCGSQSMASLNLGNNFDTGKVKNMHFMFADCGYIMTSLNLGNKFDTEEVENMSGMFWACGKTSMLNLDLGNNFNTSNVEKMANMFAGCGSVMMISLDLGDKFDTTKVTDMRNMFSYCGAIAMTTLDLGPQFTNIPSGDITITNADGSTTTVSANNEMFRGCGTADLKIYAPESIYLDRTSFK